MQNSRRKILCTLLVMILWLISGVFNISIVYAQIGDIGHWRDNVGSQIPGTNFAGFNFGGEIRNDGIYSKPSDDTIQLNEAGDYLVIATTSDEDNSNGRYNSQLRIEQTSGTGELFTSHYTGYSRDNSENISWTRAVSVIIGASVNSQIQVQKRRDTDAPTGGSIINASDVQVIRLDQTAYGIYGIGGTGNAYGGTAPNTVDIDSIISESNTTVIEGNTTTETITLKGDNKKYLIAWSASFAGGGNRTQRTGYLEYDNIDALSTSSYCYHRNATNEYCGIGSMDILETSTTDVDIQAEIFRGVGVANDEGGADNDATMTTDGNGQMIILEMPDSLEVFRSEDSVGLQDITSAQTLNFARNVNFSDAGSFTKNSDSQISVTNSADIFSWANIWTARGNISSASRQTSFGSIIIDGVAQTTGMHGNYSRGNQSTTDTYAMSFHPAGIFTTSGPGATLGINTNPLAGGEPGGNDRTQPGTVGFFALNLDTMSPSLSITKTNGDADNIVNTNEVVGYTITLTNSGSSATGISITDTIDSDFGIPYNFMYTSCGSPSNTFTDPTLSILNISVNSGDSCIITYDLQVDSGASGGSIITNSADPSAAIEGGNDPAAASADNLTIRSCGVNDVVIIFETDNYGEDTYWSLTPNGNTCGVGEIANGGNPNLDCTTAGTPATATAGQPYIDNSSINEGPFSLTVGSQFDLHVGDDFGDGISVGVTAGDPDVRIQQNGVDSNTFEVENNGGIFTFTVQEPTGCTDTTDPSLTIDQAPGQSDPTGTDSATFKVVFDEAINTGTFTAGDILLSGTTGTITSGPTQVSPNNNTSFEFTVTGMTDGDVVTAVINGGIVQDIAGNTNNASTSSDNQITYNASDTEAPNIDSINFASGALLPGGNHDIIINYSDSDSGIDTGSNIMQLFKWDGVSSYGSDLFGTKIFLSTLSSSGSSYSMNNLDFGKYQYRFSISDNAGNSTIEIIDFYIDEPEFIISSGSIDIGNLSSLSNSFSDTVTVTVRTLGAAFDVNINRSVPLLSGVEEILSFSGAVGYGYQQSPYTETITEISSGEILATQGVNINTNGFKNTYTYDIEIGALIDIQQAAGEYMGNLDFGISLTY